MTKKITLIGAGSAQFGMGMLGDIFLTPALKGSHISLLDINKEAVEWVKDKTQQHIDNHGLDFTVSATLDRKEALKDADFVIISIEVGNRFDLWDIDWNLPQQYGIRQVYGENGGVGGLFHALRITPPILEICDDINDICPNAWVFNYSNPMSRICTTVLRKYPNMNFVGMCHEIASLERYLPKILNIDFEDLNIKAAGLNHFSVLLEATYKDSGKDAYADIRRLAPEYFGEKAIGYSDIWDYYKKTGNLEDTENYAFRSELPVDKPSRQWTDRGLFKEILEKFNYLPITVDSHFGEYIGWAYDKVDHKGILDFYDFYRICLGQMEPKIHDDVRHERATFIMEALITGEEYTEPAVNIANKGAIRNLPDWIVVEVPAIVSKNGLKAVEVDMPASIGGLLSNQVGIHDLNAKAILEGSKEAVIQAILVDPVTITNNKVDEMVDAMIDRQAPWLDYLK
ncbi:MAG: alpha-glucosidase [Alphaproteobacteria bacterium]